MTKRIRLTSHGSSVSSNVYDDDTREKMLHIYRVRLDLDVSRTTYRAIVWTDDREMIEGDSLNGIVFDGPIEVRRYPFKMSGTENMEADMAREA